MARPYRLQAEGCLYHITSRGNERKNIFKKEEDCQKFISYLINAKEKYYYYLYAYVLMSNHYHLLLETTSSNLSSIMHYINSSYTGYFNRREKRSGHLFQGRFKSLIVDKDAYLLELTRYIHLNPVRARIVSLPEEYEWSSYRQFLRNNKNELIDNRILKKYLKLTRKSYERYVLKDMNDKVDIFNNVYGGFLLGGTRFIKDNLKLLGEQIEREDISYRRELKDSAMDIDEIEYVVRNYYGITAEALYSKKERSEAGKVAIYILKRRSGLMNREIGERFGISHSCVSKYADEIAKRLIVDKALRKKIKRINSKFKG